MRETRSEPATRLSQFHDVVMERAEVEVIVSRIVKQTFVVLDGFVSQLNVGAYRKGLVEVYYEYGLSYHVFLYSCRTYPVLALPV